ncbi:MAG: peptide-methionine (S)-S-oxide reductase MsrA [Methanoregula sp.]|nr:peptide-methionine (S)-S-oxide reductase MsrA [Methanoregula sp.]
MTDPVTPSRATFAGGCFWDLEAAFRNVEGVAETVAGYTGGTVPDPDYEQVSAGSTGHIEAVGIVFDPAAVSYEQLLDIFWAMHDPTRPDGQGDYTGPQYRSTIFYHDEKQEETARASRDRLAASKQYGDRPIVTEIRPASTFWPAEECHQQFYEKCSRGYCTSRQIYE